MIEILSGTACALGESALWDPDGQRLHWVDILGGTVFTLDWRTRRTTTLDLPGPVGSVGLRAAGGLVAALRHAVAVCDTELVTVVAEVETGLDGNRCNDGAVDPAGRFWFGTMDLAEAAPSGAFYCLHPDGTLTRAFGGIVCSNGPAWSPDGRTMYHVDSTRRRISAYEFDVSTGTVGPGRLFASDEADGWYPDGVTVDADGYVWNCKWDGGRIVRYAPDGRVDRVLPLPVRRPTRCAFAGPDLSLLAVTSAATGLSDPAPEDGHTLLVDPGKGVRGLPPARFAG
ncbi:SMP-30/gluconolactonase/LRE family protein [Dactylosporangium sp. AC04546]|uniref:SMP-30/gluconolactonase/LRE family protein n=1 Tax=Dactylosporangium sp. AC04546 TaxID=2862460 RepID=UPI001EE14E22|nr:SMP-30/gluconolactonase/LRE family protein [Dactylosporangium sp. AC04546]WVK89712.1 SMP-30/gluconolactonase/LRE family protein [Dactylosporangium sp. AC04546]